MYSTSIEFLLNVHPSEDGMHIQGECLKLPDIRVFYIQENHMYGWDQHVAVNTIKNPVVLVLYSYTWGHNQFPLFTNESNFTRTYLL